MCVCVFGECVCVWCVCVYLVSVWCVFPQERCHRDLSLLEKTIQQRQRELDRVLPCYTQHKEQEEQLNTR